MTEIDRRHCLEAALQLREKHDCAVQALAVAGQIEYAEMHAYLAAQGRKHGKGTSRALYMQAFRDLGFKTRELEGPVLETTHTVVEGHWRYALKGVRWVSDHWRRRSRVVEPGKDYQARTVRTLARELSKGTFIVRTREHVLCLRDGVVHDWTSGRRHQIKAVYEVTA